MCTVATSASTVALSVAVTAMVRLFLLTSICCACKRWTITEIARTEANIHAEFLFIPTIHSQTAQFLPHRRHLRAEIPQHRERLRCRPGIDRLGRARHAVAKIAGDPGHRQGSRCVQQYDVALRPSFALQNRL